MSELLRGLLVPLRRDKQRDLASGEGADLLGAKVLQVLMTAGATPRSSGELPWRTAFGAGLDLLRHLPNDAALGALARVYVRDALRRWVPEVELISVDVASEDDALALRVRFRSATQSRQAPDLQARVAVALEP